MKKILIILLSLFMFTIVFSEDEYVSGKIIEKIDLISPSEYEPEIKEINIYLVKVTSGDRKGEIIEVKGLVYRDELHNIKEKIGDNVTLYYEIDENGMDNYFLMDLDRIPYFLYFSLIVLVLLVFATKYEGIKLIGSIIIFLTIIYKIFIPAITKGKDPVLLTFMLAILVIFNIFLFKGFSLKNKIAFFSSLIGVIASFLASIIFIQISRFSAYESNGFFINPVIFENLKIDKILTANIILVSLGGILAISYINSHILEKTYDETKKTGKSLIKETNKKDSYIFIGILATFITVNLGNLLFLTTVLFIEGEATFLHRFLNIESIAIVFLKILAGVLGMILSYFSTFLLSAKFYK